VEKSEQSLLAEFLDYWRGKCAGRPMPTRADIDPLDIPRLLPHVYLVDVHEMPLDFTYRLLGTEVIANTEADFSGRRLSEIKDRGSQGQLLEIYARVWATGAPSVDRILYRTKSGNQKYYENVVAPISTDGERVDMLFGASIHLPELAKATIDGAGKSGSGGLKSV
jgi:hypothetical protein